MLGGGKLKDSSTIQQTIWQNSNFDITVGFKSSRSPAVDLLKLRSRSSAICRVSFGP